MLRQEDNPAPLDRSPVSCSALRHALTTIQAFQMAGGGGEMALAFAGLPVKVLACDYVASGLLLKEPSVRAA